MKKLLALLVGTTLALHADNVPPGAPSTAGAAPVTDTTAEHEGYPPMRYEELWTKSPFAVETPDEPGVTESAEYSLVGIAQLPDDKGGMTTYASLVDKQNAAHILVSSDKPLNGLALNSISKKSDGTYATLTHNGESLTLKLESNPAGGLPPQPVAGPAFNNNISGGQNPMGIYNGNGGPRPLIRIRRPIIHVPPRAPAGQPSPPPGAQ